MKVAKERIVPAGKWEIGERSRHSDVDADHSRADVAAELAGGFARVSEDRRSISEILGRCLRKQGFRLRPGAQSASLTLLIKSWRVYILANLFVAVSTELLCARAHDVIGRRDI